MDSIKLNKEYKLNVNDSSLSSSSLKLMLLRYSFKPSSIDNSISGALEIDNNHDYNITLFTKDNKEEKFKSQSHHIIQDKNNINEYVLFHSNDEITLLKPSIDVHNIKHLQEREYVFDQSIINTAMKTIRNKTTSKKSNRILLAEAMLTKKKVEKPKKTRKYEKTIKKLNENLNQIDSKLEQDLKAEGCLNQIDSKLEQELKAEGWLFDNKYIGMKCRKFYDNKYYDGMIIAYLPANINDGLALWYYLHNDTDHEDLEEHEIIECNKFYEQDIRKDPNERNKRKRDENKDGSESESESENENVENLLFGE